MTEIFVQGLHFFGFHGVHEFERANGNDFLIDVHVWVNETTQLNDSISSTFDYSLVSGIVERVNSEANFLTIERLARRIAEETLVSSQVLRVAICLKKLNPPMAGEIDCVGVKLQLDSSANTSIGVS